MSSSSSFSLPSSSSSIEEENGHPPPTSMLFRFQQLEEQIIIATTTTTQLRVPSIMDIIGCDITIEDIQSTKQELINNGIDLKMDVNKRQKLTASWSSDIACDDCVTPLLLFCGIGNLLVIKLLFLIGADCAKLCIYGYKFPMLAAAKNGHFDICKWLFEYGGDAKYQINKETGYGDTPLRAAYAAWHHGWDKEGKTCRWLLLNGGGQHFSSEALRLFSRITRNEGTNSNLLVLWMRENIQLHDTFILLLCGATTMNTSSSSSLSEPDEVGTCKRKRKIHPERSLQILDGHPGIMESIGNYNGLIRGKEYRMLTEFNESVIAYNNTYQSSSDDDDESSSDNDDESSSDNDNESSSDNDDDNGEDEE